MAKCYKRFFTIEYIVQIIYYSYSSPPNACCRVTPYEYAMSYYATEESVLGI